MNKLFGKFTYRIMFGGSMISVDTVHTTMFMTVPNVIRMTDECQQFCKP